MDQLAGSRRLEIYLAEATNRITAGEAVEVQVSATIDGTTRNANDIVGRDSEAA